MSLLVAVATLGTALAEDRIEFSGDLRYRIEDSVARPADADPRLRQRIRARLGARSTILEEIDLGLRLRTGNPLDPNSSHVDLGHEFASFGIALDRAYLKWRLGDHFIAAGKFDHPFVDTPVYSGLVWDGDIQGEGLAANVRAVSTDGTSWDLKAIAYNTVENRDDLQDGYLLGAQSALGFGVGDGRLTLSNAYYHNAEIEDDDGDVTDLELLEEYRVVDNLLGGELALGGLKLSLGGRFVTNLAAEDDNIGWQAGVGLPLRVGGDWTVEPWADVHSLQANATMETISGDDHQAGMGYTGVTAGLAFKRGKLTVQPWLIMDQPEDQPPGEPGWYVRARADVTGKF